MSHFSVLICLPKGTELATLDSSIGAVMDRWDESREVAQYREYEDGPPGEFWWVRSVRRGAEHLRSGDEPEVRHGPIDSDRGVWSNRRGTYISIEQAKADEIEEWEGDALWAGKVGDDPTWEAVVRLYNEKYHPSNALALVGDSADDGRLHYDSESGRAYMLSTRNPEGLWDYWRIGGRWGDYFVAKGRAAGIVNGARGWDSPKDAPDDLLRCDGGPKRLLDFEVMRNVAASEAHERYDRWEKVCADTPPIESWEHLRGLAEVGEIAWVEARERYNSQPRVRAAQKAKLAGFGGDPVEVAFLADRDEYVAEARRAAVPGYALVTLEGDWLAPGRMGWFGMSSEGSGERSAYRFGVNRYLDDLDPDAYVVVLDCHV